MRAFWKKKSGQYYLLILLSSVVFMVIIVLCIFNFRENMASWEKYILHIVIKKKKTANFYDYFHYKLCWVPMREVTFPVALTVRAFLLFLFEPCDLIVTHFFLFILFCQREHML